MEKHTENELLTVTVPAGVPAGRPWEGCINSVNYRVPRGVPVTLPRFLAEHIERTEAERLLAREREAAFASHAEKLNR